MNGLEEVKNVMKSNDYATSLDISQAFHHIPVNPSMITYLCFAFDGHSYAYQGMPFGVSTAPRQFAKTL
jgi:selenocysteine lyase/cysteine desulfurase